MTIELEIQQFERRLQESNEEFLRMETLVRAQQRRAVSEAERADMLERATRRFLLDALLAGLDWDPDDATSMAEEGRGWGPEGERFYFDYVGMVPATGDAVLLFEAKGYDVVAPRNAREDQPLAREMSVVIAEALRLMKARELSSDPGALEAPKLLAEWQSYLQDMKDYVGALTRDGAKNLRRVAISSGQWLIIFEDPADAFTAREPKPALVHCFPTTAEIVKNAELIHGLLHRRQLVDALPSTIDMEQAIRLLSRSDIVRCVQGVLIATTVSGARRVHFPNRAVYPAVIIETRYRVHAIVHFSHGMEPLTEPSDETKFSSFLFELQRRGQALLRQVEEWAGEIVISDLEQFVGFPLKRETRKSARVPLTGSTNAQRPGEIKARRLVTQADEPDEYLVATGPNWYHKNGGPQACPFHERLEAKAIGVMGANPPLRSKTSFTEDGQLQHCAHDFFVAGRQSAGCHVAAFDTNVCCQGCTFVQDCWVGRTSPKLPCPD